MDENGRFWGWQLQKLIAGKWWRQYAADSLEKCKGIMLLAALVLSIITLLLVAFPIEILLPEAALIRLLCLLTSP